MTPTVAKKPSKFQNKTPETPSESPNQAGSIFIQKGLNTVALSPARVYLERIHVLLSPLGSTLLMGAGGINVHEAESSGFAE
jgi:hypothetical protein